MHRIKKQISPINIQTHQRNQMIAFFIRKKAFVHKSSKCNAKNRSSIIQTVNLQLKELLLEKYKHFHEEKGHYLGLHEMVLTFDGLIIELLADFRAIDAINSSKNKTELQNLYIIQKYPDFPRENLKKKEFDVWIWDFSANCEILVDHSARVDEKYIWV